MTAFEVLTVETFPHLVKNYMPKTCYDNLSTSIYEENHHFQVLFAQLSYIEHFRKHNNSYTCDYEVWKKSGTVHHGPGKRLYAKKQKRALPCNRLSCASGLPSRQGKKETAVHCKILLTDGRKRAHLSIRNRRP